MNSKIKVKKRDGRLEDLDLNKIMKRIRSLSDDLRVNADEVAIATVGRGLKDGITTRELDEFAASVCESLVSQHPDYPMLGGRILLSSLCKDLAVPYELESSGHQFSYQAMVSFKKMYAKKDKDGNPIETPHMMMWRVAEALGETKELQEKIYHYFKEGAFTFATPILMNAGKKKGQLASCFLQALEDDSAEGIMNTVKESALISKNAGGIGINIHNLRERGSPIYSTGSESSGIVPFAKLLEATLKYFNQGGRRPGKGAVYLEMHHPDLMEFLDLKKHHGDEDLRARHLHYALWIPDIFMERLEEYIEKNELHKNNPELYRKPDIKWSFLSPHQHPHLHTIHGDEYKEYYLRAESNGKYTKQMPIQEVWGAILKSLCETGSPYVAFKDHVNRKCNQQNIGTIRSSNLCCEITEYSDEHETAVCNLASLSLPYFTDKPKEVLEECVGLLVRGLNRAIDTSYYPDEKTRLSNLTRRPLGIGVQGLADYLFKKDIVFEESAYEQEQLFKTIYYAALKESNIMALEKEATYEGWEGSPISQGKTQPVLWGEEKNNLDYKYRKQYNSLLIALMPTVSTSVFMGNTESFEPITSNYYCRTVNGGEYTILNKYLLDDCQKLGVPLEKVIADMADTEGSVQSLEYLPKHIRDKYKCMHEIDPNVIVDLAAVRGKYVCQSQSMNQLAPRGLTSDELISRVSRPLRHAWKNGLKTGVYYQRTQPALQNTKMEK